MRLDHFDVLAPIYDRVMGPPRRDRLARLLELGGAEDLLEAGGGTGRAAAALGARSVTVLDPSPGMLRRAHPGIRAVRGRAEKMPFHDRAWARILVVDAFHHVRGQQVAMDEFARLLAPGGILVIEEPNPRHPLVWVAIVVETLLLMRSRFRSPAWIAAQLRRRGLSVSEEKEGYIAWLVARRESAG